MGTDEEVFDRAIEGLNTDPALLARLREATGWHDYPNAPRRFPIWIHGQTLATVQIYRDVANIHEWIGRPEDFNGPQYEEQAQKFVRQFAYFAPFGFLRALRNAIDEYLIERAPA